MWGDLIKAEQCWEPNCLLLHLNERKQQNKRTHFLLKTGTEKESGTWCTLFSCFVITELCLSSWWNVWFFCLSLCSLRKWVLLFISKKVHIIFLHCTNNTFADLHVYLFRWIWSPLKPQFHLIADCKLRIFLFYQFPTENILDIKMLHKQVF